MAGRTRARPVCNVQHREYIEQSDCTAGDSESEEWFLMQRSPSGDRSESQAFGWRVLRSWRIRATPTTMTISAPPIAAIRSTTAVGA
jgi:hypothetical protein